MTCEELGQAILHPPMAAHADSSNFSWTEKRRRRRISPQQLARPEPKHNQQQQQQVISGMLQVLATISSDSDIQKRGVCLVPRESDADAACHLHQTLLEAYCREIGLRLLKLPERALRESFGRQHEDLGCLLVLDASNFFLESPE